MDFLSCKAEKVSDVYIAEFNNIQNTSSQNTTREKHRRLTSVEVLLRICGDVAAGGDGCGGAAVRIRSPLCRLTHTHNKKCQKDKKKTHIRRHS